MRIVRLTILRTTGPSGPVNPHLMTGIYSNTLIHAHVHVYCSKAGAEDL